MNCPVVICCSLWMLPLVVSPPAVSQIQGETVILSDRVGEVIDAAERERFHVFPNVKGFQSARVLQTADSLFYVVFEIEQPTGEPQLEYKQYSVAVLRVIAEKIEHFEELVDGSYTIGTQPARLKTVAGTRIAEPAVRTGAVTARGAAAGPGLTLPSFEPLPFSDISARIPIASRYPQYSFSGGVVSYRPDASDVWKLVWAIAESYRSGGYAIAHQSSSDSYDLAVGFAATVAFSPTFDGSLEVVRQKGFVTYKSAGLSARFFPPEVDFDAVRLYGSAGIHLSWYGVNVAPTYGNRVGPVDSVGRFVMLATISIRGSQRILGSSLGAGIEVGRPPGFPFGLTAYARYIFSNDITVSSPAGEGVIRTRGVQVGATLTIHFE